MRFMKQVGDGQINLEQSKEEEAQNWSDEYLRTAAKEDGDTLAQTWAREHVASNGKLFFWYI